MFPKEIIPAKKYGPNIQAGLEGFKKLILRENLVIKLMILKHLASAC